MFLAVQERYHPDMDVIPVSQREYEHLERLAEMQNERLGRDLRDCREPLKFRGIPLAITRNLV